MEINELRDILNGYFGWNKARMYCFVCMLLSLFKVRTVNLTELACGFESKASVSSRYRRIKRFFREFDICFVSVSVWIIRFFDFGKAPLYLSMDRTNWRWGKQDINILMLSVVYRGIAVPLLWELLPKKGNSNTKERIALMKRFTKQFGKEQIACLLADREFVGTAWFKWLKRERIPFCIRIRNNSRSTNRMGLEVTVDALFYGIKPGEQLKLHGQRKLWEQTVFLSALRLADGELLIVATDTEVCSPIALYGMRWEIETLFSCLKSRGFNFEDTRITQTERVAKLMALVAIGFCIAHKTGESRHEQKSITINKHGRKSVSFFRYGLDLLRDGLINSRQLSCNFFDYLSTLISFNEPPGRLI